MATLRLQASDGKALLIVGTSCYNEQWYCNVFLEAENETIRLGEEGFKQIRSRMISHLHPPYVTKKATFGSKEVDYFWILNLMGPHAAIYGLPVREIDSDDSVVIKWVDLLWDKDIEHPIIRLSEEDIRSWLTTLENTEQLTGEKQAWSGMTPQEVHSKG